MKPEKDKKTRVVTFRVDRELEEILTALMSARGETLSRVITGALRNEYGRTAR